MDVGAGDECHVWISRLRPLDPALISTLSASELAWANRLARPVDSDRRLFGIALLRNIAGAATGCDSASLVIERRCPAGHSDHGKLFFPGLALAASLSYAHDLLAIALTTGVAVGVDVEAVRPGLRADVASVTLAAGEPMPLNPTDFYRTWVRKEAVVKATGEGLTCRLSDVSVSFSKGVLYRGRALNATVLDLPVPVGYVGAAVLLRTPARLVWHNWAEAPVAGSF